VGEGVEPSRRITVCRDSNDDRFLDLAVAGRADALVTGDEDLLVLHPFEGIPIVRPVEFLRMLGPV
jgi:predicted nucleic acid-binding protein